MKRLFIAVTALALFSCNNKEKTATTETTTETPKYPYTIDHPDNWDIGSTANTMVALSALKAFEDGKIDESMAYFADSVRVLMDGLDKKMSKDSLKAMLVPQREMYKSLRIKMDDWESVIAKDKSEEWVTLWYKQYWETTDGVKDSLSVIDDLKMKNGKIEWLSEYSRKFH
jgi:hypothetical protein